MLIILFPIIAFVSAALFSAAIGLAIANAIEEANLEAVGEVINQSSHNWAEIRVDGFRIEIHGLAPDATSHSAAISDLRELLGESLVFDRATVGTQSATFSPLLRLQKASDGVLLFGAVVGESARQELIAATNDAFPDSEAPTTLLVLPGPDRGGIIPAFDFALQAIALPNISLVNADPASATITGLTDSEPNKQLLEQQLNEIKPEGLAINFNITALPPQLVSPFALRIELSESHAGFTVCHAETVDDRDEIVAAAKGENRIVTGVCQLARGAPDSDWAEMVVVAIKALETSGVGLISAHDLEFTFVPADQETYDRLQSLSFDGSPSTYTVEILPPEAFDNAVEASEYIVRITKGAGGYIKFDGAFPNRIEKDVTVLTSWSLLDATFIQDNTTIRPDLDHPTSNSIVVASEALKVLHRGTASIRADHLDILGISDNPNAQNEVSEFLTNQLALGTFSVNIRYDGDIDAPPPPMNPRRCLQLLKETQDVNRITFQPGSANLTAEAYDTIKEIIEVLNVCQHVPIEISGHTDNQGGKDMNQQLSQLRADAVRNAMLDSGFIARNISTVGYGETQPIASNSNAEGREENRRIEFRLLEEANSAPQ